MFLLRFRLTVPGLTCRSLKLEPFRRSEFRRRSSFPTRSRPPTSKSPMRWAPCCPATIKLRSKHRLTTVPTSAPDRISSLKLYVVSGATSPYKSITICPIGSGSPHSIVASPSLLSFLYPSWQMATSRNTLSVTTGAPASLSASSAATPGRQDWTAVESARRDNKVPRRPRASAGWSDTDTDRVVGVVALRILRWVPRFFGWETRVRHWLAELHRDGIDAAMV